MTRTLLRAKAWLLEASLEGMFLVSREGPLRFPRAMRVLGAVAFFLFAAVVTPVGAVVLLCSQQRRREIVAARQELGIWTR